MDSRYESHIDRQIREAAERGDFDDLPGLGKALPDRGELHDPDWWLKELIRRENLTGIAPATLKLRKDIEDVRASAARQRSEDGVRALVAELNERITRARQGLLDGPAVAVEPLDVTEVVRAWYAQRAEPA